MAIDEGAGHVTGAAVSPSWRLMPTVTVSLSGSTSSAATWSGPRVVSSAPAPEKLKVLESWSGR